ncbi:MAG: hypothetical protein CHH17_12225 [Candidatus Fluviicola riflensis]|nr:MAG: hypothetical protein CHH17_12225 [Candidatus Fluviicola riflensis]
MNEIKIRKAKEIEIEWINKKYAEVGFKKSVFENELIAIAEYESLNSGLGRIVKIDDVNYELGGMYVFEEFRNKGIAEKIVAFLIRSENFEDKHIWCLPFENLENFYAKFGFKMAEKTMIQTPKEITEKHNWCNKTYEKKVLLMVKEN